MPLSSTVFLLLLLCKSFVTSLLFRGQPRDIIWVSFLKYHINNEKINDYNTGGCDVQLQIWDGDIKTKSSVQLIGQFCKDDKPRLCDHALLSNSSRLTRPCR